MNVDFVGRRQAVERLRPEKPKHRLFDEAGFRQNGRDHHGIGFEMTADLRMAETDAGPVVMVRDAVDRDRARVMAGSGCPPCRCRSTRRATGGHSVSGKPPTHSYQRLQQLLHHVLGHDQ